MEFGERGEPLGQSADDGDRHRQAQGAGAERRFRCAAHGDPDRQRILHGSGIDAHPAVQRRTMPARPRDAFILAERDQQLQLLLEQLVVVVEVVAEQREGLREGAAASHDLGATTRQEVERREVLEHADRVIGADHAHRAGEPDAFGALRGGSEHHRGRGHDQVRPVMFTDAEDIEAELVGELDLLQQVPHPLLGADRLPRLGVGVELREGVETDLHALRWSHTCIATSGAFGRHIDPGICSGPASAQTQAPSGTMPSIVVPPPRALRTSSEPLMASRRSAIPWRPVP